MGHRAPQVGRGDETSVPGALLEGSGGGGGGGG